MPPDRSASDVINTAITENRAGEYLLYGLAVVFAVTGVFVILFAILKNAPWLGAPSVVPGALCWPAMNAARRTRRENLAIRMLEAPLSRAGTAKQAAEAIQSVFLDTFRETPRDG